MKSGRAITKTAIFAWSASAALSGDIRLAWDPSTTPGVTYVLYAHTNNVAVTNSLVKVFAGTNLTGQIQDLQPGRWQFGVTARSADGLESDLSSILQVELPKAPAAMRTVVVQYSTNLTAWQDLGFFKLRIP